MASVHFSAPHVSHMHCFQFSDGSTRTLRSTVAQAVETSLQVVSKFGERRMSEQNTHTRVYFTPFLSLAQN